MNLRRTAAILYGIISLCHCFKSPWRPEHLGFICHGRSLPGQFPPALRIGALIQAALLGAMAAVVLARVGLILPKWNRASRRLVWFVVAFAALSLLLNLITPSAGERAIWAPTALLLLVSSAVVAFSESPKRPAP
jgi:hypothetical protein